MSSWSDEKLYKFLWYKFDDGIIERNYKVRPVRVVHSADLDECSIFPVM